MRTSPHYTDRETQAMKVIREFEPADRYVYDFGPCSSANGYAQIDTGDDAHYYGNWANPYKRILFSYVEGDCTKTICDTDEEFTEEMRRTHAWHKTNSGKCAVDPGLNKERTEKWESMGLADLLHPGYSSLNP